MRHAFKLGPRKASGSDPKKPPVDPEQKKRKQERGKKIDEANAAVGLPPIGQPVLEGHGPPPTGKKIKRSIMMAIELLEDCEISPLEYLLNMMSQPIMPRMEGEPVVIFAERLMHARTVKLEAAKAAAPYMHPKIGAIDPKEFKNERKVAAQIADDLRQMMLKSGDGIPVPKKTEGE